MTRYAIVSVNRKVGQRWYPGGVRSERIVSFRAPLASNVTEVRLNEKVTELRRLVKRINRYATVTVEIVGDLDEAIIDLQEDELRKHPEVILAIAECAS